jgi:hypothetical protein
MRSRAESRQATVDLFLKAAGYLDCAIHHVLTQIPPERRRELPVDLAEGNLKALSLQGLSQGVDMQLGLAIDNPKATLAVKRRLACEMAKCWKQVSFSGLMSKANGCINLFFRITVSLLFVLLNNLFVLLSNYLTNLFTSISQLLSTGKGQHPRTSFVRWMGEKACTICKVEICRSESCCLLLPWIDS